MERLPLKWRNGKQWASLGLILLEVVWLCLLPLPAKNPEPPNQDKIKQRAADFYTFLQKRDFNRAAELCIKSARKGFFSAETGGVREVQNGGNQNRGRGEIGHRPDFVKYSSPHG